MNRTPALWVSRSCWLPTPAQSGPSLETGASTSCSFQAPSKSLQPRSLIRVAAAPRCPHSPSSSQPHNTQTGRCSPHTAAQCNSQPHSSRTQPRCSPHIPSHLLQPRSLAVAAAFCPAALAAALAAVTLHPPRRPFTVVELVQVSLGALIPAGSFD